MALNRAKMSRAEVERRDVEATAFLYCACEVYRQQLREGRHFLHKHPEAARSWADEQVKGILDNPAVGSVVGHQCMYGQTALTDDGERLPVKKATRWMSSAPEVLARLGHRCRGGPSPSTTTGRPRGGRGDLPAAVVQGHPPGSGGSAPARGPGAATRCGQ